ncbi:hypothetical protein DFA_08417 [Cavenderia fasciculata]|uniref:FNIP repeat-containing protein n=1 Tax=Cavenderia fasciculata TaxID=261658 RepID=F4Q613_CACFS|nr:uncharacterized protein DFA_08417 [Cavenderia fasciculata]EGG17422.1 hypothetical protein DFA_08417 [Cavenderia fasciculata]|eukprot:XP_004355906.1 hypothetical protein DFA_08417 [Cavenderia fasciculata]
MTSLLQLSNILLLHIISDVDNNGDIVCLLLTCKKLYSNSGLRRSIQFKGIEAITDDGYTSRQFIATATRFKLNSFKDILENSISNHQRMPSFLFDRLNYSKWIQQRITLDRVDKSSIKTVLANYAHTYAYQMLIDSLSSIPSIETLLINHQNDTNLSLDSISRLPNLQRLLVRAEYFKLGPHTTLKSLTLDIENSYNLIGLGLDKFVSLTELTFKSYFAIGIEPGLLPSSLTFLSLKLKDDLPPRNTFLSLTSLVTLIIDLDKGALEGDLGEQFIDLESLINLKTLTLTDNNDPEEEPMFIIKVSVPPCLSTLTHLSTSVQLEPRCTMPLLERLNVRQCLLIDEKISILSCQSIKKLVIHDCFNPMPSNFIIPSTVKRLEIYKYIEESILGRVVLPPSLTSLSLLGDYYEPVKIPDSIVKLKQTGQDESLVLLPQQLKKLVWEQDCHRTKMTNPSSYPPNIETLNFISIKGDFTIDNIPPSIKYLSMSVSRTKNATNGPQTFSISSRLSSTITSQQQPWLPHNTTHLTCGLWERYQSVGGSFKLDEVINHTNVRYLTIIISSTPFQFSIQRLDPNNNNVLVLETQTLQGGIITQQRKSINSTQQQQYHHHQYESIYLHFDVDLYDPFKLYWSFQGKKVVFPTTTKTTTKIRRRQSKCIGISNTDT